ncbi:MAG: CapA family protein [bacterium]
MSFFIGSTIAFLILVFFSALFFLTSKSYSFVTQGIFRSNEIPKKIDKNIYILSFGDAMFDRGVRAVMNNGKDPFELIQKDSARFAEDYDFKILNLEGPITTSNIGQEKEYNFKFDPEIAVLLKENNYNLVNLANNHMLDYYRAGHKETVGILDRNKIGHFGGLKIEDTYKIETVKGKKVAFVGIDESTFVFDINKFYSLIEKLKIENDYVVVNIHWGNEYDFLPSESQKNVGHSLVDSGADIVYGHHPHVIQPIEIYKNRAIFYSLGNFIFDQVNSYSKKGIGVSAVLGEGKNTFNIFPFDIVGNRPKLFNASSTIEFCDKYLGDIKGSVGCYFEVIQLRP